MRITHIHCPGCGKAIDIDWDWTYFLCQYCHAKCVILSHNHPETPQETLERLHGEAWQTMEERNYALAFGQYREILQHRIDDAEAWHGRALAIGLRAYDKENLRADEVIASFDEGLRRENTPRSQLIFAMHAATLGETLHQFHYLHFRREPLHGLRWKYYQDASDFALQLLRKGLVILQDLLVQPDEEVSLLLQATVGYQPCRLHEQATRTLGKIARTIAAIDHSLLLGSLRLHGRRFIHPKWFGLPPFFSSAPKAAFQSEYACASKLALGTASQPPQSEFFRYWRPYFIYGAVATLVVAPLAWLNHNLGAWLFFFVLVGAFGFLRPIRHRLWEKYCYASDVRAGVYDYK